MDDNSIVELYLKRDEMAIEQSAKKYGGRLRILANGIVNDRQVAEECENDAYMEAWNCIPPHEPREYLYAFLARIARHIALNCCRNRKRLKRNAFICELGVELEQCIPAPNNTESCICDIDLKKAINGFLSNLDDKKRIIFVRRYWYLDSINDISKRFSMSASNVKTTLYRCRNSFREYLEKEGYNL